MIFVILKVLRNALSLCEVLTKHKSYSVCGRRGEGEGV